MWPGHRLPLLAAGTVLLAGCGGAEPGPQSAGPDVVAATYPYEFVLDRVGGDLTSVDNLTSPGVEPHDVELTPQQVASVSDADLVVYQKTFQPQVDDAVEQAGLDDDQALDVTSVVALRGNGDPHVWLDPLNMVTVTEAVRDALTRIDPDHAGTYRANADRLVTELSSLHERYRRGLRGCERTAVVTSHDAFQYLADAYGLRMVAIAGVDPTQEPSPAQQAVIADTVAAEGVTTIFTEELASPAVAHSIADETGAELAVLSPIEGLTDETADEDYLSLMRRNLDALMQANDCS